jgi:hypothetical protein
VREAKVNRGTGGTKYYYKSKNRKYPMFRYFLLGMIFRLVSLDSKILLINLFSFDMTWSLKQDFEIWFDFLFVVFCFV